MPVWAIWALAAFMFVGTVAMTLMMSKKQKQPKQAADQTDGSLADYGIKTSRVAGTVWIHPNNIDAHSPSRKEIKKKMGGKK